MRRRLIAALGAALVAPLVISGCAAGQRAQTANEYSVVDGVSATIGDMGVRDAGISAPSAAAGYVAGANATLSLTVVNTGNSSDTLTSVTSPSAAGASIVGPTSATPTTGGTASAAGIMVPANGAVPIGLGAGSGTITLRKLTYRLVPGQSIPVTLTFQGAGPVTVILPVKLVSNQTGGESADVSPTTGPAN